MYQSQVAHPRGLPVKECALRRDEPADDLPEPPSKSARKREAHDAQTLGEDLIGLPDGELEALELPEALLEALHAARRIRSRAGGARQRQYIGRLMRDIDVGPIRAALAERHARDARGAEAFRRVEAWRERLVREGPAALDELCRWRPELERTRLEPLVAAAQAERALKGKNGARGRELFRALESLFATMPP